MAASLPDDPDVADLEDREDEAPVATDLERVLARRTPRGPRTLATALIVVALAALILNVWRVAGRRASGDPSSTAPLPAVAVAEIDGNVTGATVTVNGIAYQGIYTLYVKLPRGTYTIALHADPLPALSCRVSWPPDPGHDTCRDSNGQSSFDPADNAHLHIALLLKPSDLPPAQRAAILSTLTQRLAAIRDSLQTTVPVGQHYGVQMPGQRLPTAKLAAAPVRASLGLALDTASCADLSCFSPTLTHFAASVAPEWIVSLPVRLAWQFRAADDMPAGATTFLSTNLLALGLLPQPDGTWRADTDYISLDVLPLYTQIARFQCGLGSALAHQFIVRFEDVPNFSTLPLPVQPTPAQVARGCLIPIDTAEGTAAFIFRFGALLAANYAAHHAIPALQLATASEVAALATP